MLNRRPLIVGNWKMHKTVKEAIELATGIRRELFDSNKADIVICPPFTALDSVYEVVMETPISLGAQDVFWEEEGAYTGEVSALMLKDTGCKYVIIGHSERRKYLSETNQMINRKIKSAINAGLTPIVCVGETLDEREAGKSLEVVSTQLKEGLEGLAQADVSKIVIAYEPVWAIGTGRTAKPHQAQEVQRFIRDWIKKNFPSSSVSNIRILYGGSVKPENIADLVSQEDIDGALVGGASLEVSSFVSIVRNSIG
jgi:triosephosphate isomerase